MRAIRARAGACALAWILLASPLEAQTAADVATLSGPDRMQKLIDGAKREGAVNIYSSATQEDMSAISGAFQKKYGVKAVLWRGGTEDMMRRALAEARAGRFEVDTLETGGMGMEVFHREGLLQPITSDVTKELAPQASFPHREWVATRMNIFAIGYNTRVIPKQDAPRSWDDLLDPRFRGKLAVEDSSVDWLASMAADMGEERTVKLFRDMVARNGVSVRKGHTLLANLIASGEVPLSITVYDNRIEQMKRDGVPVELIYMPPVYAQPVGIGVAKRAPHPHAAVLFYEFMLSDGQQLYFERSVNPTNTKIKPLPAGADVKFVNFPELMDRSEKWKKLFHEIFVSRK